jgi:hypothetical protein
MTKKNNSIFPFLLIVVALSIVGCKDKMGGPYPMTIQVTQNSTPVEGAIVTIQATSGGQTATGVTNAAGIATIRSTEGWEGVFPGEYTVTVKKTETTFSSTPPPGTEGSRSSDGEDSAYVISREMLPLKYGNAATSELKATQENKKGHFEFDLSTN